MLYTDKMEPLYNIFMFKRINHSGRKHACLPVGKGFTYTISAFLLVFLLFFTPFAHAVSVDVTDISNRAYFDATINEINNAKEEIYVAMYSMYVRPSEVDNPVYKLITALIQAQQRGVAVKVYLDSNKSNAKSNKAAYELLSEAGVPVYFIDPKLKLHAKTILIDGRTVIDGSSNWTQNAIESNIEHDVILRGEEFAKGQIEFFKQLDKLTLEQKNTNEVSVVRVSGRFLEDSRLCSRLAHNNAQYALGFYLQLLREDKYGWRDIECTKMMRRVVESLKDDYHLIDYRVGKRHSLAVRLVDYDDVNKDYVLPQENYFQVPEGFWEYGLSKELDAAQQLTYFICLYEQAHQAPKLYWWLGLDVMQKKYHISDTTLVRCFAVLEKMDLITVLRAPTTPGKNYYDRKANQYRVKPLLSPGERMSLWQKMEKKYSKIKVKAAREMAAVLDWENDFNNVEGLIVLIDKYGESAVREGLSRMADYSRQNSARNMAYLTKVVEDVAQRQ
jgi:HKD family nuclease